MYGLVTIQKFENGQPQGSRMYVEDKDFSFGTSIPCKRKGDINDLNLYIEKLHIMGDVMKNYCYRMNSNCKTNKSKIIYTYPFDSSTGNVPSNLPWNMGSNFIACPNAKCFYNFETITYYPLNYAELEHLIKSLPDWTNDGNTHEISLYIEQHLQGSEKMTNLLQELSNKNWTYYENYGKQ